MAPPVWAYQVDYFQPPPDEELICSICQSVFCDPVQSPCNHVFCRACITKWLESNRNCPICRKRASRSTLQEVVPIVKNMIMKLILRCHNSERGCKAKFTLESCEAHVKDCQYELVQCKNRPCKQMCARREIKEHETNLCHHSYVRCNSCKLKISSRTTLSHNCIDELRIKLREKNEKLKKNRQKLKKLKEEIKNLRESEDYTSDSSVVSLSPADILFNFSENSNLSFSEFSSLSSDNSGSGSNAQSSADESDYTWQSPRPTRESMLSELEQLQERINNHFGQTPPRNTASEEAEDNNTSIEFPRATISLNSSGLTVSNNENPSVSSFASPNDSVIVEETFDVHDEEPQEIRRPAKRRHLLQVLESTDEEDDLLRPSQPSRKRTWQNAAASSNLEPTAGPSRGTAAMAGASSKDASSSNQRNKFKFRPRSRSTEQRTMDSQVIANPVSIVESGNPIFEKTLSLLEQYNLESDPEWLPPTQEEDSLEDSDCNLYELPRLATTSEDSNASDLESESSYEDAADGKTEDLLNSFYGSSTSDSDEWLPP